MLQETQWILNGYCKHCGAPRYANNDLGKTIWKDEGFDCLHELERPFGEPENSGMEDYLPRRDR